MDASWAEQLWLSVGVYLGIGVLFGIVFVTHSLTRFDANAAEAAPLQFRLIILPGVVALWPVLLAELLFKTLSRTDGDPTA
jgi:hypothetical protein